MIVESEQTVPVRNSDDIVRARQAVRTVAVAAGFSIVDQTKIITAASEIARNTLEYGGGGSMRMELVRESARRGVRLTFSDNGPGIPDLKAAMTDGFTTGGGLGLGLSGTKRLTNEFSIQSTPGKGTIVTIARWR